MLSVEGTFQDGVVQLNQPIAGRNGQKVMIVFLQDENESPIADSAWADFALLLKGGSGLLQLGTSAPARNWLDR